MRIFSSGETFFLFFVTLLRKQLLSSGSSRLEATLVVFALLGQLWEQMFRDLRQSTCQLYLSDLFLVLPELQTGEKIWPAGIYSLILAEWTASTKQTVKCKHYFWLKQPFSEEQWVNLMWQAVKDDTLEWENIIFQCCCTVIGWLGLDIDIQLFRILYTTLIHQWIDS